MERAKGTAALEKAFDLLGNLRTSCSSSGMGGLGMPRNPMFSR